jgi:hypothetical protein
MSKKEEMHQSGKNNESSIPPFEKPKILLIGLEKDSEEILAKSRLNVSTGCFGIPYDIIKGDRYLPIIDNSNLPNDFGESDIVIINLMPETILPKNYYNENAIFAKSHISASCINGLIDPRPLGMIRAHDKLDRILEHGGIFIVFADNRYFLDLIINSKQKEDLLDNWSFLSTLDKLILDIKGDEGKEILSFNEAPQNFVNLILRYSKNSSFSCTFNPFYEIKDHWITIAVNKFNEPVSGIICPRGDIKGWIFIFPQIGDKASFLNELVNDLLPDLFKGLFPFSERNSWLYNEIYESPRVAELKDQLEETKEKMRIEMQKVEALIEKERSENAYLHEILTATDETLVKAVQKSLEVIGFKSVINVDEDLENYSKNGLRREDLRINDSSPILLIEVKGINGLPKDEDSLAIGKYIAPRMKEWCRTDVMGLSIINHQRNLPPLKREKQPFRQDVLINAEEQDFGLLTTWELSKIVRSYLKNDWKHEQIKDLFYRKGRITPIPVNYAYIGVIENYAEKLSVVGLRIEEELKLNDKIAFELPTLFDEQDVNSLHYDGKPIDSAQKGMLVGIKTHLTKKDAKDGIRVFKVKLQ